MGVFGASTSPDSDTGTLPNTRPWLRDQRGSKWRRASRCGSSAIAHSGSIAALVSDHTFSVSSSVADSTHGGGLDASGEPGNSWNLRPRGPSYWPRSVRWPSWVGRPARSEEQTSELQSLMRLSYAVFCLKKKTIQNNYHHTQP